MTIHYHAHIILIDTKVKLTYHNGNFKRFDLVKKGNLAPKHLLNIGRIIPLKEKDITRFILEKDGKVNYTRVEKQSSLYPQYTAAWFEFYHNFMGIEPSFNKVDGANLKKIMGYLERISGDAAQALQLWQAILSNWEQMDEFHRSNTDIKYIYSQINRILNNVKRGDSKAKVQYSEDFQRKVAERLQS